jgi:hypothetical protein
MGVAGVVTFAPGMVLGAVVDVRLALAVDVAALVGTTVVGLAEDEQAVMAKTTGTARPNARVVFMPLQTLRLAASFQPPQCDISRGVSQRRRAVTARAMMTARVRQRRLSLILFMWSLSNQRQDAILLVHRASLMPLGPHIPG